MTTKPQDKPQWLGAWWPIETAPCYGRVLLWWRHAGPRIGRFVSDETGDGWRTDGDECVPKNQADCTHWMPLPAAPNPDNTVIALREALK